MDILAILATVLPSLIPVAMDGIKSGISKLFGVNFGDPKSFEDYLRVEQLQIQKLQALADLDKPSEGISKWVADLRASMRYIAVGVIIGAAILYNFMPIAYQVPASREYLNQLAGSATFFLLGDRVYLGLKRSK